METDIIKERFIKQFGDEEAGRIIDAALAHGNGVNDTDYGSSKFRWANIICLGFECMEKYKDYHEIKAPWKELKQWIKDYADLAHHEGDIDCIAAYLGVYNEFINQGGQ